MIKPKIDDGGPAFPLRASEAVAADICTGLSKRELFAAIFTAALGEGEWTREDAATEGIRRADAVLAALRKEKE